MTSMSDEGEEALGVGGGSEVLDVSRSGRVRKKNSLLAGFESIQDEVDNNKPKKKGERVKRLSSTSNQKVTLSVEGGSVNNNKSKRGRKPLLGNKKMKMTPGRPPKKTVRTGDSYLGDGDLEMDLPPEYDDDDDDRDVMPNLAAEAYEAGYSSSDIDDRTNGNGRLSSFHSSSSSNNNNNNKLKSQAQSTYMMEKEKSFVVYKNKKSTVGVGRGKAAKDVKKEKGGPRVTAYTLWAKDQREFFSKKYPHLDASSLSRKLSEVWQTTIPPNQRKMWKNKADKIMRKNLNIKNSAPIPPPPLGKGKKRGRPRIHPLPPNNDSDSFGFNGSPPTKIIRRVGNLGKSTKIGKKLTSPPGGGSSTSAAAAGTTKRMLSIPKSVNNNLTSNGVTSSLSPNNKSIHQQQRNHFAVMASSSSSTPTSYSLLSATKQLSPRKDDDFKVTGTAPIDVAAHFALLGESLSIIGERLMDVERQPVSGSLSVLMDSLLCAITPLVCLTQQVPELKDCIPPDRLTRLLDHIAYVMPGL